MLRSLKTLGGSRADDSASVGVCLHRALAIAAVPPAGRGAGQAQIVELPTESDEQARALARAVSDLGVKGCRASVTLPLGSYHLMQIERPAVDDAELVDAARWRVKGQLDYPIEDAVIQVFEVPQSERQRTSHLNVVAAPARTIRELSALVKRAGLLINRVTIVELAVRDLVARASDRDEPVAAVFLNARQGVIQITHGGELYITRRVEYGLGSVVPTDTLATGIHMTLPLELRRTVDYFESQFGLGTIRRVLAAPTDEPFMKFMKETSEFTGLPVEPLDLPLSLRAAAGKPADYGLPEAYLAASVALGHRAPAAARERA
jgi:MSHA biogenesis protein MshI